MLPSSKLTTHNQLSSSPCQSIKIVLQVPRDADHCVWSKREDPSHGIPRFWIASSEPFLRPERLSSQSCAAGIWLFPLALSSVRPRKLHPHHSANPTRSEMSPGPQGSHPRFANLRPSPIGLFCARHEGVGGGKAGPAAPASIPWYKESAHCSRADRIASPSPSPTSH